MRWPPPRVLAPLLAAGALVTALSWARYLVLGKMDLDRVFLPRPWPFVAVGVYAAALALGLLGHARLVAWAAQGERPGAVLRTALLLAALAVPALPLLSSDLFSVIAYVDLAWRTEVDPFTLPKPGLMASRYFPLVDWTDAPCVYGPVQLAYWAPAVLAPLGLLGQVLVLKLLAFAAVATTAALLAWHLRGRADGSTLALVAASPVVWIEGAGQAHTDVLAAAFLALWLLPAARGHTAAAAFALGLALASKLTVVLPAAMWVAFLACASEGGWPRRIRRAAVAGVVMAAVFALAYAWFWRGPETLTTPLAFLAGRPPTHTLAEAARALGRQFGLERDAMSRVLGRGSSLFSSVLLLVGAALGARAASFEHMVSRAAMLLAVMLTLAGSVFHPWYLLPVLVLAAEVQDPAWRRFLLVAPTLCLLVNAPVLLPHQHARSALSFVVTGVACLLWLWGLPRRLRAIAT